MTTKTYDLFLPLEDEQENSLFSQLSLEKFMRLNPHWIISNIKADEIEYQAEIKDHETETQLNLAGTYELLSDGFPCLKSGSEVWKSIRFFKDNNSLFARVEFSEEPEENVERQVVLWLRSVKEYLRMYAKTNVSTLFFRFLMNRVILTMTPSQRKISLMLIRITVLEIIAILAILVGWFFLFR